MKRKVLLGQKQWNVYKRDGLGSTLASTNEFYHFQNPTEGSKRQADESLEENLPFYTSLHNKWKPQLYCHPWRTCQEDSALNGWLSASGNSTLTLTPHSQLIQRSPRVRKQATACLARWWIQPSCRSCVMIASIQGKPVLPSAHFAKASGFLSQGIWMQIGFPSIRSNLGLLVAAV